MSDHKHIYLEIQKCVPEKKKKITYKAIDYEKLYNNVESNISNITDNKYDILESKLIEAIEHSKTLKIKILNPPKKDWINKDIIAAIDKRNQLWRTHTKMTQNKTLDVEIIKLRREVRKKIQDAKTKYYYKEVKNCTKTPFKMWRLINSLGANKIKTNNVPPKIETHEGCFTKIVDICNCFNSFFANIGSILAKQIPQIYHNNDDYIQLYNNQVKLKTSELIKFTPTTMDEVSKIIDRLNVNTSTGLDGISCKSIKCLKNLLLDKLTFSINECIDYGYFPDSLKLAKVSPIFKSGKTSDPSNYRPISVLPAISKIFEKVIFNQLNEYLSSINFIYDKQYGFRSKSSTLSACIDLVTNIKNNIDKKQIALGIFIDLKKAFDTISHKLLLQKLQAIGVKGTAYSLIQSYLSERKQVVKIGESNSNFKSITFGVPQGSILGPLLFLIYINDIKDLGLAGEVTLYADDTCLFYFGNDVHKMLKEAQDDLNILYTWFQCNLLTINISKTKYMIFRAKNKKINNIISLHINNESVTEVESEKYLGLTLDSQLTWKPHIAKVQSKLSAFLGILRRTAHCFPKPVRYTIYNSLVKSRLSYLIELWGSAAQCNLKQLEVTQNKIIKVLFRFNYSTPTSIIYNKTKLMSLMQMYKYNTCIIIRKILNKSIHSKINFTKQGQYQKKSMRNANNISLQAPRTNYGIKNIVYEGAKIYNKLPNSIKDIQTFSLYKKNLKNYITNNN